MRNAGERANPVTVGSAPEFKRGRGERGEGRRRMRERGGGRKKNEREGGGGKKWKRFRKEEKREMQLGRHFHTNIKTLTLIGPHNSSCI